MKDQSCHVDHGAPDFDDSVVVGKKIMRYSNMLKALDKMHQVQVDIAKQMENQLHNITT